ncbi:helix-turn-helix domain-containing protein [Saccharopolyspora soli]|uniref:helix-turn-helix domain-containing protein n=1 Tax=Saccharopolyspora soli TaxID=2926618 RepID=UPI003557A859
MSSIINEVSVVWSVSRQARSLEDIAEALGVHRKTVYGWLARYREGGKGSQ